MADSGFADNVGPLLGWAAADGRPGAEWIITREQARFIAAALAGLEAEREEAIEYHEKTYVWLLDRHADVLARADALAAVLETTREALVRAAIPLEALVLSASADWLAPELQTAIHEGVTAARNAVKLTRPKDANSGLVLFPPQPRRAR